MDSLAQILGSIPDWLRLTAETRSLFMADLVMLGEIPSLSHGEEKRIEFILQRFGESGLDQCSMDEKGNGIGLLPGTSGRQNILITSNADTFVTESKDQTIEIHQDRLVGPFVGDNSIALAALTHLPLLLQTLQIKLKSNLVLLASTRALGRGNLEGIRHFLANGGAPIASGICIESVQL